jgi:hypothetical protein
MQKERHQAHRPLAALLGRVGEALEQRLEAALEQLRVPIARDVRQLSQPEIRHTGT